MLGQNVNAYRDLSSGNELVLVNLINKIATLDKIKRLRYMTSHPLDMSDAPIDAHGSIDKLMPQLHLPVQSGSNKILKAMNRRHTYEKYLEIIDKLRQTRADMCFSSDIIVGYPGETEKDFQDTIAIIKEVKFAQVYSFKYSPRPGTPAAELPQLPEEIKTERLRQLQALTRVHQDEFNAMSLDKNLDVLITNKGKRPGQVTGFSQYLQSVVIDDGAKHIGNIVRVKIIKILSNTLKGEVI